MPRPVSGGAGDRTWHHRSERPNRPGSGVFRGSLPVPRSSALNTQTLIALGPECLAELLLELAGSDPAIKRRIRSRNSLYQKRILHPALVAHNKHDIEQTTVFSQQFD